jgi:hypothetical protein
MHAGSKANAFKWLFLLKSLSDLSKDWHIALSPFNPLLSFSSK